MATLHLCTAIVCCCCTARMMRFHVHACILYLHKFGHMHCAPSHLSDGQDTCNLVHCCIAQSCICCPSAGQHGCLHVTCAQLPAASKFKSGHAVVCRLPGNDSMHVHNISSIDQDVIAVQILPPRQAATHRRLEA